MAKEIERKFLVVPGLLDQMTLGMARTIVQGYLSAEPAVRVRTAGTNLGRKGYITVKGPGSLSRAEYEYEVPVADADEMMALCKFKLEKVRRGALVSGHVWEVDFFSEPRMGGLVLAEIELRREDEEFTMPSWAGEEVTGNPYYSNVSLAKTGPPKIS